MICGIGVDIADINRVSLILKRHWDRFLVTVFTLKEREIIENLAPTRQATFIAGRWAAKEAVLKAIGTGIGPISLHEVLILQNKANQPQVELCGRGAARENELKIDSWFVSISHEKGLVIAIAIAECQNFTKQTRV